MHDDVDAEVGTEDVLADVPGGVGIVECLGDALVGERHLTADVEEATAETGRIAGDQAALDQLVRIALHEEPVLVGAGLGLVAVDDEVPRPDGGRHEAPLGAGREAGAPATEQRRLLDLFADVGRRLLERLAQALIATGGVVAIDGVGVLVLKARGDDLRPIAGIEPGRPRIRRRRAHVVASIQTGAVVTSSGGTAPAALSAGMC
jgi:hypothetical protein